jgi:hypothetical protein
MMSPSERAAPEPGRGSAARQLVGTDASSAVRAADKVAEAERGG